MVRLIGPDGPPNARVMIIGEAPGAEEELKGVPFVGASGMELNRMLGEAGLSRSESFVTNIARVRPPGNDISAFIAKAKKDRTPGHTPLRDKYVTKEIHEGWALLQGEISRVQPKVIITLGNIPLWALTGKWGINKWRGSQLEAMGIPVIPTLHPAYILRSWSERSIAVGDLRRAARIRSGAGSLRPAWNFRIRPNFVDVTSILDQLYIRCFHGKPVRMSFDLETRAGHIACAGISWSPTDAICIPFMVAGQTSGYFTEVEETEIVLRIARLLTHPNAEVVGQNILYDSQYTWRWWHFVPRVIQDTMIGQHSIFSDMPKGLAFLASMYCDWYVYWKDEGKNWAENMGEDQLWNYNCQDCVYTDEVGHAQIAAAKKLGLTHIYEAQQAMFWPVLRAMQLGIRIDPARRNTLVLEVQDEVARREQFIIDLLGHPLNPRSPKQMQALFYEDLKQPVIMKRATKNAPAHPTLDDEALLKISAREPLLRPLVTAIQDIRTLGIFLSNFLLTPLDTDGRMRCAYNIGGSASGKSAPKTYRLSSSENAFGSGGNLQNIPSAKSKSVGKAKSRGAIATLGDAYSFPNIRSMFIPDTGCTLWDGDLDRADLQVVAWEADDELLKSALRLGVDIHLLNCYSLRGIEGPPMEELCETHPRYKEHREPNNELREFSKTFCHGTNYGGGSRTMAANVGRTVHEVERSQRLWFGAHPGIKRWHDRVELQVRKHHFVENRFGYRWYIFDRVEGILPEAIAWIPQSTVSIVINRIWANIYNRLKEVDVLMQVHDSLVGQFPIGRTDLITSIVEQAKIVVPYPDPLVIPFSVKTSNTSWGDVK